MFFGKFPIFSARLGRDDVNIEDFFIRIAAVTDYTKLVTAMTPYMVKDGERIEDVAFRMYGDPMMHWVILLVNNITNIYEEWPLAQDVLYKRMFENYVFTLRVPVGHQLVAGMTVQSSEGDFFSVVTSSAESVVLRSMVGVAYLTRENVLYSTARQPRVPVRILSVDDPLESIHHYEGVASGYWVDFNQNDLGQGLIRAVSNLEYEQELNDSKRNIRVLDKRYLNEFVKLFDRELNV